MADSWLMTADFLAASPSRKDGISAAAEADLKRKTCKLMLAAAHELAFTDTLLFVVATTHRPPHAAEAAL
eukprot:18742-Heterococcus_DN1.PRE.1